MYSTLNRRAVVRRLRAPADPDRVAALAALALVGQGGRGRAGADGGGRSPSSPTRWPRTTSATPWPSPPWPRRCWSPAWPVRSWTMVGLLAGRRVAGAALPPRPRGRAPAAALAGPGRRLRVGAAAGRPGRRGSCGRRRRGAGVPVALSGPAAAGHRGGDPALPAVRPGPHHQPHRGLRAADGGARPGATPARCWWRASCSAASGASRRAGPWPARPWPWRRCSSRPGAASSRWSTAASTGAATTPPTTVEAFAARLRDQVDLDALQRASCWPVVAQTVQPTRASLWLRRPAPSAAPKRRTRPASKLCPGRRECRACIESLAAWPPSLALCCWSPPAPGVSPTGRPRRRPA